MKKYSSAVIFALLLIFVLSSAAFADNIIIYEAPGAIYAGQELNHLAASVPKDSIAKISSIDGSASSADWLRIETSPDGESTDNLYLKGSTLSAGSYTCFINVSDVSGNNLGTISCTINVLPAMPQLSFGAGPIECNVGDSVQLSISASVNDGGSLSYRWYSNGSPSNSGGIPLDNGNSGTFNVNTKIEGTTYYYCEVTNTNNSQTAVSVSSPCKVTVKAAEISSISVVSLPNVTVYKPGDSLNSAGLSISLNFSDGSSRIISEGFSLYPMVFDEAGLIPVTVSYGDKSCTFNVNVEQEDEIINGIGVLTKPYKTEYILGTDKELITDGLSIRVYTNLGQRDVSEGFDVSPRTFSKAGEQEISVSYGGKSCTFTVTVKAEDKPVSLSVLSKPQKLNYTVGEKLDTTGLTLRQTMSSGEKNTISEGFSCTPTEFTKAGPQTIEVSFGEFKCSFNVNVTEKKAEPSKTPIPENTASPESAPHVSQHEPHKAGTGKTVLIIVMVIAVLALISLGVYAVIMNRRGEDNFVERIKEFLDSIKKDR